MTFVIFREKPRSDRFANSIPYEKNRTVVLKLKAHTQADIPHEGEIPVPHHCFGMCFCFRCLGANERNNGRYWFGNATARPV